MVSTFRSYDGKNYKRLADFNGDIKNRDELAGYLKHPGIKMLVIASTVYYDKNASRFVLALDGIDYSKIDPDFEVFDSRRVSLVPGVQGQEAGADGEDTPEERYESAPEDRSAPENESTDETEPEVWWSDS